MRSLSVALIALVVAVNGAGLFRDLSGITTKNSLAVLANVTDSSAGWTISNVVAGASYVADGTASLPLSFNVSFTGSLPDFALFFLSAYVTVSGPGTFPNYNTGASCNPFPGQQDGVRAQGGAFTRVAGGAAGSLSFSGSTAFKLTATGAYTATITLYKLFTQVATGTFTFTASAAATAPTLITPTISTFYLPASQTNSTPGILTVLTPATFDAAVQYSTSVYFNAPSPQGVVWATGSAAVGGTFDAFSQLFAQVGGWCGNSFADADILSGTQVFPQAVTLTVGGVTISKNVVNGGSNSVQVASGNTQFVSTVGSTDVLPPTCTSSQFASTTVVTNDLPVSVAVNTVCTDASNSLLFSGAFVRATTAAFTQDFLIGNGDTFDVYPYLTGSIEIIGVAAVDAVGNAAVYGSCGTLGGQYASLCGGSSASSIVASLAVVMMCIMTVFAL